MKKYCITTLKDGLRVMKYPHNAYGTHETEIGARNHLIAIISNNNLSDIESLLGDITAVKIMPVECYQSGDPKQTVFGGE